MPEAESAAVTDWQQIVALCSNTASKGELANYFVSTHLPQFQVLVAEAISVSMSFLNRLLIFHGSVLRSRIGKTKTRFSPLPRTASRR
jgi:hypothetical protein